MTPKIYDIRIDDWREVTQADVDELVQCKEAFGMLREDMKTALARSLSQARGEEFNAVDWFIEEEKKRRTLMSAESV